VCKTVSFHVFRHEQFQITVSLHSSGSRKILENVFPPYVCPSRHYPKFSSRANLFTYRQLSSVEFAIASFLSVPCENRSGCLHENFKLDSKREVLSRLGIASRSAWNGSISSRVNTRPFLTFWYGSIWNYSRANEALIKVITLSYDHNALA